MGKFPDEIVKHMDMDDLREFAGYLSLQNPKAEKAQDEMTVEGKLIKALGAPE